MLSVLSIISVAIFMPAAAYVSLRLNMFNRITIDGLATASDPYVFVAQTFLLNNIIYLISLFATLYIFFIREARVNIKWLISLAVITVILAIPQLNWIAWSIVDADTLISTFLHHIFFDIEKTLMFVSVNFVVYVLLIIRELKKRKEMR